jgi:hypothetical protein
VAPLDRVARARETVHIYGDTRTQARESVRIFIGKDNDEEERKTGKTDLTNSTTATVRQHKEVTDLAIRSTAEAGLPVISQV